MTMTMTSVLDRVVGIGDPERVDGNGGVRPDAEVPERGPASHVHRDLPALHRRPECANVACRAGWV